MKITVLDGFAVNPGDLDWGILSPYGEVTVYDRTASDEESIHRIADSEIVMVNKTPLPAIVLENAPKLKLVCVLATGYNVVDCDAARKLGITVCNVPAYSTAAVAQLVFSFILHFASRTSAYNKFVQSGGWIKSETFSDFLYPIQELAGKTIGIIGYGSIGRKVAHIAQAFNMNVIVNTRTAKQDGSVKFVGLKELFSDADVITAHCPLTEETMGLINKETLSYCKPSCVIINTSRGPVVNEQDLADALNSGKIAGAALDVLCQEPMSEECPLIGAKNCIITPHIAWAPLETRERLVKVVAENVKAFIEGYPINTVN